MLISYSAFVAVVIAMTFLVFFILEKRDKKVRSENTFKLQLKLFKAVVIQAWLFTATCVIPLCFMLVIYLIQPPGSAIWVQIVFALSSLHGPADLFSIG